MPTSTVEDYIKQIYMAAEKSASDVVSMGCVAESLGVVPGTATTMVKTLYDAGLVEYEPRVGVKLTKQGNALALHVLRRHRLLEQFLVDVLGFDWSEVHDEAERMEHVVSDLLVKRIDAFLGYPAEDPHGDPIPTAEGMLAGDVFDTLASCPAGVDLCVARISDQDTGFLRYIAEAGLNPGVAIRVQGRSAAAESVDLELVGGGSITLGLGAAAKVHVRQLV